MNEKPNIVFIHTDQQRGDCLGCAGHPVLETPTMDNLACNGVRLSSFYAGCPVCVAARRSILTGQSPQKHGIISNANKVVLNAEETLTVRAAYYAAINHVDTLLRRLVMGIGGLSLSDTLFVFTSDHGEMLGDHCCWRKMRPFEGAARVPFLIAAPNCFGLCRGHELDVPASHHDIMPTLLDMLGLAIPETVDGRSLYPLLRGETGPWRDYVHVEHGGYQHALTDGKHKYVWDPRHGSELFFDLEADPGECHNLAVDNAIEGDLTRWRERLVGELSDRPEGFVKAGALQTVSAYGGVIPWETTHLEWQPRP